MLKFLFPHGNTPFEILKNCAKEEFGEKQTNANKCKFLYGIADRD